MITLPVFIADPAAFRSGRPRLDNTFALGGSCLLLSPTLALTCNHVTRDGADRDSVDDLAPAQSLIVSLARIAVHAVIRADLADDLALLELESAHPHSPVMFARQHRLDDLQARGFSRAPFAEVESNGPISVDEDRIHIAGAPRHFRVSGGIASGFSGGPLVGTYAGQQYCVGLNRMGGTGRAESVFTTSASCAQFLQRYCPGVCHFFDFAPAALADFLKQERERLWRRWQTFGPLRALVIGDGRGRISETPIVALDRMNAQALSELDRGTHPRRFALPIDGHELTTFLASQILGDPVALLRRFLDRRLPRLAIADTVIDGVTARGVVFVIIHDDHMGPLDGRTEWFLNALTRGDTAHFRASAPRA